MGENITAINLLLKKSNFFLAKEDNQFLMSYYFNDLMSNQQNLIDEKVQHDGLILLVFVSKNCQSGPLSSFAQHSRIVYNKQGGPIYWSGGQSTGLYGNCRTGILLLVEWQHFSCNAHQ